MSELTAVVGAIGLFCMLDLLMAPAFVIAAREQRKQRKQHERMSRPIHRLTLEEMADNYKLDLEQYRARKQQETKQ